MLSCRVKRAAFSLAGPFMAINGWLYRTFRAPRAGIVRVQLGPGQHYLEGWINVDANVLTARCDVWADLRNALPFHDASVDAFYSHHVIEHLPDLRLHFANVFRCLKPGGVYRVGGPHGDSAIKKFMEGDGRWFTDFPDKRRSIGGKLENFIFCRQEHLTILTFSFLEELLIDTGFIDITECLPTRETRYPHLFSSCLAREYESTFDCPHTMIVEARKSAS